MEKKERRGGRYREEKERHKDTCEEKKRKGIEKWERKIKEAKIEEQI